MDSTLCNTTTSGMHLKFGADINDRKEITCLTVNDLVFPRPVVNHILLLPAANQSCLRITDKLGNTRHPRHFICKIVYITGDYYYVITPHS